jgi:hypothetical protein
MGVKETDGFRDIMAGVEIQKGLKDRKRDGAENKIYIYRNVYTWMHAALISMLNQAGDCK